MKFIYPAIFRKNTSGTYQGFFPDLDGCLSIGETLDDAIEKANEAADDWQRFGDPWSRRRDSHEMLGKFADQTVRAVPYDMPVIGYHTSHIGTLRLWQSEALEDFDFQLFNDQE